MQAMFSDAVKGKKSLHSVLYAVNLKAQLPLLTGVKFVGSATAESKASDCESSDVEASMYWKKS